LEGFTAYFYDLLSSPNLRDMAPDNS
jgi:hypothetical protein